MPDHLDAARGSVLTQAGQPSLRVAGVIVGQVDGGSAGSLGQREHGGRPPASPDHQRTAELAQAIVQVSQRFNEEREPVRVGAAPASDVVVD